MTFSDIAETHANGLPKRAEVAMLTLRLRGLQQKAKQLEAQEGSDPGAALRQLEARIKPLVDERRRALHTELERERVAAELAVAEAERQAEEVLRSAPAALNDRVDSSAEAPREQISDAPGAAATEPVQLLIAPLDATPIDADILYAPAATPAEEPDSDVSAVEAPSALVYTQESENESEADPISASLADRPTVFPESLVHATTPEALPPLVAVPTPNAPSPAVVGAPATTTVVIDAEAFARVFATVLAELLDSRLSAFAPQQPIIIQQPAPTAVTVAKKSGWAHALHADVLLMTLTMIVVLVVLAAWLV